MTTNPGERFPAPDGGQINFQTFMGTLLNGNLNLEAPVGENTPIDMTLLRNRLPGKNTVVSQVFKKKISQWAGSWESRFAPLGAMALREEVHVTSYPLHMMEQAAENSPARNIVYSHQSIQYDMEYRNLQAEFSNSALMDEETAMELIPNSMEVLVSAAVEALKDVIIRNLLESPIIWMNRRQRGNLHGNSNIIEATAPETSTSFIFSRGVANAVEKVTIAMVTTGLTENDSEYNAMVLPEHTYKKAIMGSDNTVFAQSGPKNDSRLANAVQTDTSSIIAGVQVYSDKKKRLANNPNVPVNNFVAEKQYGQCWQINNTDTSRLLCTDCNEGVKMRSIKVPNAHADDWTEISTLEAAKHDGRYNIHGDGELNPDHDRLLQHLDSALQRTKIEAHENFIDPFMWHSDVPTLGPDQRPVGHAFRKIKGWGDIDLRVWLPEQSADFGQLMKNRMMQEGALTNQGNDAIFALKGIVEQLNNFDPVGAGSDAAVQGYYAAIRRNPENLPVNNGYLKANSFGSVQPPFYDSDRKAYYYLEGGERRYPAAVVTGGGALGTANTIIAHVSLTGDDYDGIGAATGATAVAPNSVITTAGLGGGTAPISQDDLLGTVTLRKQEAENPVPFGMGNINGLLTLQRLFRSGQFRGYPRELLTQIDSGLNAILPVARYIFTVVPRNMFTDPSNVPFFMKTNDDQMNAINTMIASLFMGMPHPVMVRNTSNLAAVEPDAQIGTRDRQMGLSNDALDRILGNFGFNVTAGTGPLNLSVGATPNIKELNQYRATFGELFANRSLSSIARNAILNESAEIARIWRETMGKSYADLIRRNEVRVSDPVGNPVNNVYATFAWFYREEIQAPANNNQSEGLASLLSGIIGLLKGNPEDVDLTPEYIAVLKKGPTSVKQRKREAEVESAVRRGTGTNVDIWNPTALNQWVNTRTTSSKSVWRDIHAGLGDNDSYSRFYNANIRPADPSNTAFALAGGVFGLDAFNDTNLPTKTFATLIAARPAPKESLKVLQFARARRPRGMGVFEEFGLVRAPPASASRKATRMGPLEESVKSRLENLEFGGEDEILPDTMLSKDFVEVVPYQDRFGRETPEMPGLTVRVNLLDRIQFLNDTIEDPIVKMASIVQVMADANWANVEAAAKRGFPHANDSYIICAPFIRQQGGHALMFNQNQPPAKSGILYDTAAFQMSAEYMKWILHANGWFGCTILDEHGFLVTPFALDCIKYESGWSLTFWDDPEEFDPQNIDFVNDPDTFVFNVGSVITQQNISDPMTLDGLLHQDNFLYQSFDTKRIRFGGGAQNYPSALYYTDRYGLDLIKNHGLAISHFSEIPDQQYANTLMFSGKALLWNTATKSYSSERVGTSHFRYFPGKNFRATLDGAGTWHEPSAVPVRTVNSYA